MVTTPWAITAAAPSAGEGAAGPRAWETTTGAWMSTRTAASKVCRTADRRANRWSSECWVADMGDSNPGCDTDLDPALPYERGPVGVTPKAGSGPSQPS